MHHEVKDFLKLKQVNSIMNHSVKKVYDSYPVNLRIKLMEIRAAVFELSDEAFIGEITETLKWGQPSYLAKHGSTVRLGWDSKDTDHISVYFNCHTILVETFKEVYGSTFKFVGNREIKLSISEPIPMSQLMSCISLSLRYHKIKHLPLLGV